MIEIHANAPAYRVAAAELPMSVRLSTRLEDAIVVVTGEPRWAQRASAAFEASAAAVIVSDPSDIDAEEYARLREIAAGRPLILERPLLRADLVSAASGGVRQPSYVAVDATAASRRRAGVEREAAGWARVLLGGRCIVRSVDRTDSAVIALVEREDGQACGALTVSTLTGADEGAWMRATSVADSRVEVVIDEADARASIDVATASGIQRVPRLAESRQRLSVRRAVQALASAEPVSDLDDLRADVVVAGVLKRGGSLINDAYSPHRENRLP